MTCVPRLISPSSDWLAKQLKKVGYRFVGPTTIYAFMQSAGLVNDHLEGCFVRPSLMGRGELPIP